MDFNTLRKPTGIMLVFMTIIYVLWTVCFPLALIKSGSSIAFYVIGGILWGVGGWLLWRNGWRKLVK